MNTVNSLGSSIGISEKTMHVVQGIKLNLPVELLTPRIKTAIETQKYEHLEARQLGRFLRDGDTLLEFGGGIGFISALAAKKASLNGCVVVEANPILIPVIEETHRLNKSEATIINAVALSETSPLWSRSTDGLTAPFFVSENFWESSLTHSSEYKSYHNITMILTKDFISNYKPTVIICDIEGGEIDIFENTDLTTVRMAFFEVHKNLIGLTGINHLIRTLEA